VPLSVADQVILVVNPELASMADALKTKILCEVHGREGNGAILNRAGQEHTELRSQSVEDVLGVRVVDVVPEDASVRRAAALQVSLRAEVSQYSCHPGLQADRGPRCREWSTRRNRKTPNTRDSWTGSHGRCSGDRIFGVTMAYENYILVLFGGVIVVQQFIIYLMYVRIRQLLGEIDSIEGKIRIHGHGTREPHFKGRGVQAREDLTGGILPPFFLPARLTIRYISDIVQ